MTDPFDGFQRGLMTGSRLGTGMRHARAQTEAARLMSDGNITGASQALMAAGLYSEAGAMTDVSMTNQRREARQRAGGMMADGRYGDAAGEFFRGGDFEDGRAAQTEARNREAGGVLTDDPHRAAAIQAAGGNIEGATALLDWSRRADAQEREAAMQRVATVAPILNGVVRLPYEQRRAAIAAQSEALSSLGISTEQIDGFDPTDDNIRAMSDSVLGLEKILGGYSQREVGDEVRTYRTNPYGVERVGSETVPYSRDEGRDDKRLELEEERLGLQREQLDVANSTGDVVGPLLQRYSRGEPLNAQEDSIVQHYLRTQQGAGMFGMPGGPFAPPSQPTPPTSPNGAATSNRSGISPTGAGQADPFPGIADGQIVEQDGVRYQRRGNQMIRAQ